MLRLIKSSHIEIELREKQKGFSPTFLKALLLATTFHLLLFLSLRIASSSPADSLAPLPLTAVEIDLGSPRIAPPLSLPVATFSIETSGPPELPDLPTPSFDNAEMLSFDFPITEPDFSEIEKIEYTSGLLDFEEENDYR